MALRQHFAPQHLNKVTSSSNIFSDDDMKSFSSSCFPHLQLIPSSVPQYKYQIISTWCLPSTLAVLLFLPSFLALFLEELPDPNMPDLFLFFFICLYGLLRWLLPFPLKNYKSETLLPSVAHCYALMFISATNDKLGKGSDLFRVTS